MLLEAVLGISGLVHLIAFCKIKASQKLNKTTEEKESISPIVLQLQDSLINDKGWVFLAATSNTVASHSNKNLEIGFTLQPNCEGLNSWGGIYKPNKIPFNETEHSALSKTLEDKLYKDLIENRTKLISEQIEDLEDKPVIQNTELTFQLFEKTIKNIDKRKKKRKLMKTS